MAAAGRKVTEPMYERVCGMPRVRVEVDGDLCVMSGVDGVNEGRGQGD
jgi:hypothetical protein